MSRDRDSKKPSKIEIRDVEDWDELVSDAVQTVIVEVEKADPRRRTGERLSFLFGGLLCAYIAYAMAVENQEVLRGGFELVRIGLTASLAWTFGRRSAHPENEPNS